MEIYCKNSFLILASVILAAFCRLSASLESASPEKYLLPRNYNPHPYRKTPGEGVNEAEAATIFVQRFVKRQKAESGRKGPVLFPNNAPQSTNNPLIVTSRPLAEEIARKNQKSTILTPTPPTIDDNLQQIVSNPYQNTARNPAQNYAVNGYLVQPRTFQSLIGQYRNQDASQIGTQAEYYLKQAVNPQFRQSNRNPEATGFEEPGYNIVDANGNVRVVDYKNLQILQRHGYLTLQNGYQNARSNSTALNQRPYGAVVRKTLTTSARPRYDAVEEQTVVPPLYRALDRYAKSKALDGKGKQTPQWRRPQQATNTVDSQTAEDEYYSDDAGNGNKHYAFSYSVKDHHTGDDFSHSQRHTGSGTNGEYRVKLPDGRTQIVSYTADNGGYKADVRYQEDPKEVSTKQTDETQHQNQDVNYQKVLPQNAATTTNPNNAYFQNEQTKLGRIVVPSLEETDYQDVYYYDHEANKPKSAQAYNRGYVTNDAKEVLITSRPGYLYTPSATPSHLLYKQFTYHADNDINSYTASPRAIVYLQPAESNVEQQRRDQPNHYSSTTASPQDASRTYSHFYNAESVKFISTTPKYPEILRNSIAAGRNRITSTTPTTLGHYLDPAKHNSEFLPVSSTVAPGLDNYDHLDTPDVVKIEPRPKTNVRYTSLAPVLYNSESNGQNNASPTAVYPQTGGGNSNRDSLSLGRYLGSAAAIDLRKYFTFKKR